MAASKKAARKQAKQKAAGAKRTTRKKAAKKRAKKHAKKQPARKKAARKKATVAGGEAGKRGTKKAAKKGKQKAVPDAAKAAVEADLEADEKEAAALLPPMPKLPTRSGGAISLAFGSTADQAFMIHALADGLVDTEGRTYDLERGEVQDFEAEAARGVRDVTVISYGAYPALRDRYLLLPCGGAYGDHQGPVLVARTPIRAGEVDGLEVAVPGEDSAAAMALRLWLPQAELRFRPMATREVSLRVRAGHVRAGLLVDEDIVTYRNHNLVRVVDLGQWWGESTEGLPLALGAHVIRRDIPAAERAKIALDLKRSIAYALGHREESLDWAMQYAGKHTRETLDRIISRYVNDLSLDCGERGRQAARMLFRESARHGFLDRPYEPIFHGDKAADA